MNREIKFRVWSRTFNRFLDKKEYALDLDGKIFFVHMDMEDTENLFVKLSAIPYSTYTIQQFTGLKDKNDKDIYEGDFIQGQDYEQPIEIVFQNYGFGFRYSNKILYFSECNLEPKINSSIVGNIFENPKLSKNPPTILIQTPEQQ